MTDAAVALIHEVVARATDLVVVPRPAEQWDSETRGRPRPVMRQVDRAFSWSDATDDVVRQIRAADGAPGVRTALAGTDVFVYNAQPGPVTSPGHAGMIMARHHGALLVRTGEGAVWIGQIRRAEAAATPSIKLPATIALIDAVAGVPELLSRPGLPAGFRDVRYERTGDVGVVSFDFYNGAMSTADCRRLAHALQRAVTQDTRVLVVRGGETFSNGIHLNVIDAAVCPEVEAWQNIMAIDEACRMIITCTGQLVVAAVGGSSGAGGTMLALGADRVVLRDGVVLNPHYATMGLYGSEYWTYVLPRRVGDEQARQLTYVESFNSRVRDECLNINLFWSLAQARVVITDWKEDYNHRRRHSSLGYQAPAAYAASSPHRNQILRAGRVNRCSGLVRRQGSSDGFGSIRPWHPTALILGPSTTTQPSWVHELMTRVQPAQLRRIRCPRASRTPGRYRSARSGNGSG